MKKGFFVDYNLEEVSECTFVEDGNEWISDGDCDIVPSNEVHLDEKKADESLLIYLEYRLVEAETEVERLTNKIESFKDGMEEN